MLVSWRARAAKIQAYFEQGESVTHKLRQLAITAAALKILGLPLWAIAGLAPFLFIGYIIVGWIWINHGWYKQNATVGVISRWSPVQIWQMNALAALLAQSPTEIEVSVLHLDERIAAGLNSIGK